MPRPGASSVSLFRVHASHTSPFACRKNAIVVTAMSLSSQSLHPEFGARFVFEREGDAMPPVYRLHAYVAGGQTLAAVVRWTDMGRCVIDPALEDPWAQDEALKLARVLHRDPSKLILSRWRDRAASAGPWM